MRVRRSNRVLRFGVYVAIATLVVSALLPGGVLKPQLAAALAGRSVGTGTMTYYVEACNVFFCYTNLRQETVTFVPARIEPGESLHVVVNQVDIATTAATNGCIPAVNIDNVTFPLDLWHLTIVGPGQNAYDIKQGTGFTPLPVTGTWHQDERLTCPGDLARDTFINDMEMTIDGATTAGLTPGCYQTTGWNPHLIVVSDTTGTFTTLSVGGADCGVPVQSTSTTYTSGASAQYSDGVALSGTLLDTSGIGIAAKQLDFTLGTQHASASPTDGSGNVSTSLVVTQKPGSVRTW